MIIVQCLPGAKCTAICADVVKGRLSSVGLLFPLPFVDDELPLEMGQELEVLLLLGHTHHLEHQDRVEPISARDESESTVTNNVHRS